MSEHSEKLAIRAAFEKSAKQYDSVADVQREIADALLQQCSHIDSPVLDAGCGTGYLSRNLQASGQTCIALDIAENMLAHASGLRLAGDVEALPIADQSVAHYLSSLAWQWVDACTALSEAARVLKPGGKLNVATLGPQTLGELREAYHSVDALDHVRRFARFEDYEQQVEAAGFEDIQINRRSFVVHAQDFLSVLQSIRTLGARVVNGSRPKGLFGRGRHLRVQAHYENQRVAQGLPVSYDVIFISARRKP